MDDSLSEYCASRGIQILRRIGGGKDGTVYETTRPSAIKKHVRQHSYLSERDAYFRLEECAVTQLNGFRIPTLFDHDDDCLVLEMSIVQPPFLLDFASAWLDDPPEFTEDAISDWHTKLSENFDSHLPDVLALLEKLKDYGIHLFDIHPDNIKFRNSGDN